MFACSTSLRTSSSLIGIGFTLLLATTLSAQEKVSSAGRTYVGALAGGPDSSRIALVVDGKQVMAYLCSDDDKFNARTARWFRGTLGEAGNLDLTSDGLKLHAKIDKNRIEGSLLGPTTKLSFEALPVGEKAGLFRAEGKIDEEEHVAGWIVDGKGTVVGAHHKKTGKVTSTGSHFHHVRTFHFDRNHAFHRDFDFHRHFFFKMGMHHFHAKKVVHVPSKTTK